MIFSKIRNFFQPFTPKPKGLLTRGAIEVVFNRVEEKVKGDHKKLFGGKEFTRLELLWVLLNKSQYIEKILEIGKSNYITLEPLQLVILKQKEKDRKIYVSPWLDRIYIMALAERLAEIVNHELSPNVFSFQRGKGPFDALNSFTQFLTNHKNKSIYVIRRDISSYGDTIPQNILRHKLEAYLGEVISSDDLNRIFEVLRCPFQADSNNPEVLTQLFIGVPSGSPLVPPLENFYLRDLDQYLESHADSFYMRYGDDFLFATEKFEVIEKVSCEIETIVHSLGLVIKDSKKQNYLMLHKGSKLLHSQQSVNGPPYQAVHSFEVLGRRVRSRATLGPKREKLRDLSKLLDQDLAKIFYSLKTVDWQSDRGFLISFLNKSLAQLTETKQGPYHIQLIHNNQNIDLILQFDHSFRNKIRMMFQKELGLKPREAWRLFRKLKINYFVSQFRNRQRKIKSLRKENNHAA